MNDEIKRELKFVLIAIGIGVLVTLSSVLATHNPFIGIGPMSVDPRGFPIPFLSRWIINNPSLRNTPDTSWVLEFDALVIDLMLNTFMFGFGFMVTLRSSLRGNHR